MNHSYGCTANTAVKKANRLSAARALVVGLTLALSGAVAQAGEPIPGVDVNLGKNPGGIVASVPTGPGGTYQFTGLAPGKYELFVGGQPVKTRFIEIKLKEVLISGISTKQTGSITGALSREPDGKAKITFNGQTALVLDLFPGAPVSTTRSNKKAGIVAENDSPQPSDRVVAGDVGDVGDVNGDGVDIPTGHAPKKASNPSPPPPPPFELPPWAPTSFITVPQPTDPLPDRDVKPGISDQGAAGGLISYGTAPPPKDGGAGKLPGLAVAGDPIPAVGVGLEGDPEGIKVSANTDEKGAFLFSNLPAGNYKVTLPDGLPAKLITIDSEGIFGGTLRRGPDGGMRIFDRWGNQVTAQAPAPAPKRVAGKPDPGGFGSGNLGGFPVGGPGAMLPGAGPMSPMSPMSPMGPMGGPGAGAVRR